MVNSISLVNIAFFIYDHLNNISDALMSFKDFFSTIT